MEKPPPMSMIAKVKDLDQYEAHHLAREAVIIARRKAPKFSGASAKRFTPYSGPGFFGIKWQDSWVWFQEQGIKPFTMKNLAGKTIPMWISDPTGKERTKNPKAKTRVTASGVTQVLIFRRAAIKGAQKSVLRNGIRQFVPASYPGAPGRIGLREVGQPLTATGKVGGQISTGNVGVRWRHPGLTARHFLAYGITEAASNSRVAINQLVAIGPDGETSVSF